MRNTTEIRSDGINVYVTASVKPFLSAKIALTLMNIIATVFFIFIASAVGGKEMGKSILVIPILGIIMVVLPWRFWCWNFFGKENIIINAKTISYSRSYGIVESKLKTMLHRKLATSFTTLRIFEEEEFGRITFWSYNESTNLPENLFENAVLIRQTDADKIIVEILKVFANEVAEKPVFGFSEN